MYFDTHAHYDDRAFDEDRDAVLSALPEAGLALAVDPGASLDSSRKAAALAEQYPFLYAAVGIHPEAAQECTPEGLDELRALAKSSPRVVAIGEIGLDNHWAENPPREVQLSAFEAQLTLARELGLPVIVHEREACADCLDMIAKFKDVRGVLHCFSGSWETAKQVLEQGWYLSFTGSVTFKNARRAPEVLRRMPMDRLMLETDSPYMAPVPVRGTRNDSRNIPYIAGRIAELMNTDAETLCAVTAENGRRFFGLDTEI